MSSTIEYILPRSIFEMQDLRALYFVAYICCTNFSK